jgi:predicted ester cyclase
MALTVDQSVRERRDALVREHVAAENRHDVEATIATFDRPRYEVMPFGEPNDGESAVRELLQGLMAGFPDFHAEVRKLHHADDAVILEGRLTGTHEGPFAGIPRQGDGWTCRWSGSSTSMRIDSCARRCTSTSRRSCANSECSSNPATHRTASAARNQARRRADGPEGIDKITASDELLRTHLQSARLQVLCITSEARRRIVGPLFEQLD